MLLGCLLVGLRHLQGTYVFVSYMNQATHNPLSAVYTLVVSIGRYTRISLTTRFISLIVRLLALLSRVLYCWLGMHYT